MNARTVQRALVVFAALVCLLFTATLSDYAPYFLLVRTVPAAPVPGSVGQRDAKLAVHVEQPGGAPVAEARVTVLLIRDDIAYLAGYATTDDKGDAAFDGLPRGVVWILADADQRGRRSTQLALDQNPRSVKLTCAPAYELAVEVTSDEDAALAGAEVRVQCSDPLPFIGKTDELGVAKLGRLCPPPYTLHVSADGYESAERASVVPGPRPIRVSLRRLGWLEVSVVTEQGDPAPLSTILLAGPGIWPARQTQTNAFGRSKIAALPAGTYDLRALRGELVSPITTGVMIARGKATQVKLILSPGRHMLVHVVGGSADDAPPVAEASVVLVEEGVSSFPMQGRTGADGTLRLGPLPDGPLTASARAEGFVSPGAVSIPAGTNEVRIGLLKAGRLLGEVVDNRGFPVPGASIEVIGTDLSGLPIDETPNALAFRRAHFAWALQGPPTLIPAGELGVMPGPIPPIPRGDLSGLTTRLPHMPGPDGDVARPWVTDDKGMFSVHPIPPGRVSAIVRHPAYVETISEAVTLAPGGVAKVRVVLYAGGTLEGVVLDDRRFPIAGVLVRITAKEGSSERSTITADDGAFAFSAVAPELIVTASRPESPEKVAFEDTIAVGGEERKEIEIILKRERDPIAIHVIDDRGYPIDGARARAISLTSDVSLRTTAFTDKLGDAKIEDAAGLNLRVEISASGYATNVETLASAPKEWKVTLDRGIRLQGTVTGRGGRERVAGAKVTLYLPTGTRELSTGEDGVFKMNDITPGPLRLRVAHSAYVAVEKTVKVERPNDVDRAVELASIDLERAGTVEGEVVDDRGNPVAGAKVAKDEVPEYLPLGPLPPGVVATNEKGEFTLEGLPEGELILEAFAPGVGRGKEERIAVRKDRTTTRVRIRLERSDERAGPAVMAGIALTFKEAGSSGMLVAAVIPGSSADRAGMAAGDLVVRIDGVAPSTVADAMHRLRGPERQDALFEVQRGTETMKVRVPRERIRQ